MDLGRWLGSNRAFIVAALVGSLVGGLVCGVLSRVAMSVIAAAGGDSIQAPVGILTLPGTLRIIATPIVFGLPFVFLYLWLGRRLWARRPLAVRAVAYGVSSLLLPGLLLMTDSEFSIAGPNSEIGRLSFIPAYIAYGLFSGLAGEWWLRRAVKAREGGDEPLPAEA